MADESRTSKKKPATAAPDDADVNGALGYISITELRNVFTHRIRQLDGEIWPRVGRTPMRDELLDFYITTMIDLMQKAQRNYEQFCKRLAPPVARQSPQAPAPSMDEQKQIDARKARMQQWIK